MKADLSQAILTHIQGTAEGWALQLIEQYEIGDWPEWSDIIIGAGEDVITTPGLCTLIKRKFT